MNPNYPQSNDPNAEPKLSDQAAEMARRAKQGLQEAGEEMKEKAGNLATAAREKLSEYGGKIGDAAANVRDKVGEKVSDLREGAADLYHRATARVRTLGDDGVEFVRENPVSTVLTVFAAGVLLGYTLRRS